MMMGTDAISAKNQESACKHETEHNPYSLTTKSLTINSSRTRRKTYIQLLKSSEADHRRLIDALGLLFIGIIFLSRPSPAARINPLTRFRKKPGKMNLKRIIRSCLHREPDNKNPQHRQKENRQCQASQTSRQESPGFALSQSRSTMALFETSGGEWLTLSGSSRPKAVTTGMYVIAHTDPIIQI